MFKNKIIFTLLFIALFCVSCFSQTINKISGKCSTPYSLLYSFISVDRDGNIDYTTCGNRTHNFIGAIDFSGATINSAGVTGTPNYFIHADSLTVNNKLASSNNQLLFTPNSNSFFVGDTTQAANDYFQIQAGQMVAQSKNLNLGDVSGQGNSTQLFVVDATQQINFFATGTNVRGDFDFLNGTFRLTNPSGSTAEFLFDGSGETINATADSGIELASNAGISFGDLAGVSNGTLFIVNNNTKTFTFNTLSGGIIDFSSGIDYFKFNRTITGAGTTGNQTINKPVGTVNFAAGASDITITNSTVSTTSLIFVTGQRKDVTCTSFVVDTKAAGSFHIKTNAACTAETSVAFQVTN